MTEEKNTVGFVTAGHSQFDDRMWNLITDITKDSARYMTINGFDFATITSLFVLSGASIEPMFYTNEEDRNHETSIAGYSIKVPNNELEKFYVSLESNLKYFMKHHVGNVA